jgi:hypothetical protein
VIPKKMLKITKVLEKNSNSIRKEEIKEILKNHPHRNKN